MINRFETTGIGSLPFTDPSLAVELVLSYCDIPYWPQLPRRSFRELMIPQFTEGLPGILIDVDREKAIVESTGQEELNHFYELYSNGYFFPVSEEYSSGFYAFLDTIKDRGFRYVKGQITGPLTFTLGLKKSDGRYIYFDEELREAASLLLQRKAQWQVKMLSHYAEKVMIFIDEPILTAIGSSSYIGVESVDIERLLKDMVSAIKSVGGVAGIHCCGRADWGMLTKTGVDILNFDAYEYFSTLKIYAEQIGAFFKQGGYLAWGIIPTTEAIQNESVERLRDKFVSKLKSLSETLSEDYVMGNCMLTPSCGAGGRTVQEARKIFSLLKSLGETMRR